MLPDNLGLGRAQCMNEPRFVQIAPLEQNIEAVFLSQRRRSAARNNAPCTVTQYGTPAPTEMSSPVRRSAVCAPNESERCSGCQARMFASEAGLEIPRKQRCRSDLVGGAPAVRGSSRARRLGPRGHDAVIVPRENGDRLADLGLCPGQAIDNVLDAIRSLQPNGSLVTCAIRSGIGLPVGTCESGCDRTATCAQIPRWARWQRSRPSAIRQPPSSPARPRGSATPTGCLPRAARRSPAASSEASDESRCAGELAHSMSCGSVRSRNTSR